jgi:hypothetical protein
MVKGLGLRVWGQGLEVGDQGVLLRFYGSGSTVLGLRLRVEG